MKLIDSLKKYYRRQVFIPAWYSIVINSNYIISRGISSGIKKNAHYMVGTMLDFGCGTKPYHSLFNVKHHIGVEIKNSAHNNDISFVDKFYDGKKIPFDDEYFDSLFSSEALTHIFNVEEIIPELNRVLKKNGCFLLTVPFVWKENEKPNDSVRYTSFGIKYLLKKNGFEIIVQEKKGNYLLVVAQLFNDYLFTAMPNIKLIKFFFTLLIIFPLTLVELFFSFILPVNKDIFINNIIVARKK
ncbi:MAG: class I SAM-dependent methyltransferase [Bacteroidetes bacterium]|nr:class I SAM-dependent methyltransferase [Bacteroidota bacterium]